MTTLPPSLKISTPHLQSGTIRNVTMPPDCHRKRNVPNRAPTTLSSSRSLLDSASSTSPSATSSDDDDGDDFAPSRSATTSPALIMRRQLILLLLIRCVRTAHLAQPILVPYYSSSSVGLSAHSVLWLGSLYSFFVIVAEMPSGYASDKLGRRRTLHLAFLGLGSSLALTSLAGASSVAGATAWWILASSQLLRAIGSALFSGTDMALLYETLKRYKSVAEADKKVLNIESKHVFLTTITEAAFSGLGGVSSEFLGLRPTVAASALPFFGGAALCLMLEDDSPSKGSAEESIEKSVAEKSAPYDAAPNPREDSSMSEAKLARKPSVIPMRTSALTLPVAPPSTGAKPSPQQSEPPPSPPSHHFSINPKIRRIFIIGVALNCGTYVAATALNPLLWSSAGIPTMHFGWIGSVNGVVSAGSALMAPSLRRLLSSGCEGGTATERLLFLLVAMSAVAFGLMSLSARAAETALVIPATATLGSSPSPFSLDPSTFAAVVPAIGGSVLLSAVRGLAWPVLGSAINAAIAENSSRATTLSIFAGAVKAGMVATSFILGTIIGNKESRAGMTSEGEGASIVPGLSKACATCGASLACVGLWMGGSAALVGKWYKPLREKEKST